MKHIELLGQIEMIVMKHIGISSIGDDLAQEIVNHLVEEDMLKDE